MSAGALTGLLFVALTGAVTIAAASYALRDRAVERRRAADPLRRPWEPREQELIQAVAEVEVRGVARWGDLELALIWRHDWDAEQLARLERLANHMVVRGALNYPRGPARGFGIRLTRKARRWLRTST